MSNIRMWPLLGQSHLQLVINHTQLFLWSCFAAIENIDITKILSHQEGEAVYPVPRIRSLVVHPKLNLAALLFAVKHGKIC